MLKYLHKEIVMVSCKFTYTSDLLKKITKTSLRRSNTIMEILLAIILVGSISLFAIKSIPSAIVLAGVFVFTVVAQVLTNIRLGKINNVLLNQTVELDFDVKNMKYVQKMDDAVLNDATIDYGIIKKIKEVDDLLYLYLNSQSAFIIPKNSFKSMEEYRKAFELVSNNYVE